MPSFKKMFFFLSWCGFLANSSLASELSYTNIGQGLIGGSIEVDELKDDIDYSGAAIGGSFAINGTVFITASLSSLETDKKYSGDEIEQNMLALGTGAHFAMSEKADFVLEVGYTIGEQEWGAVDVDMDGFFFAAGIRGKPCKAIELSGFINHSELDYKEAGVADESESNTGVSLEARYFFTAPFSVGISLDASDNEDGFLLSARYDFTSK